MRYAQASARVRLEWASASSFCHSQRSVQPEPACCPSTAAARHGISVRTATLDPRVSRPSWCSLVSGRRALSSRGAQYGRMAEAQALPRQTVRPSARCCSLRLLRRVFWPPRSRRSRRTGPVLGSVTRLRRARWPRPASTPHAGRPSLLALPRRMRATQRRRRACWV